MPNRAMIQQPTQARDAMSRARLQAMPMFCMMAMAAACWMAMLA